MIILLETLISGAILPPETNRLSTFIWDFVKSLLSVIRQHSHGEIYMPSLEKKNKAKKAKHEAKTGKTK